MSLFGSFSIVFAQSDAENCKDYPLFNRIPNFYIDSCSESFNVSEITVGINKTNMLEGSVSTFYYVAKENLTKLPSVYQIIKNFENAILSAGGSKIYSTYIPDDEGFIGGTYKFSQANNSFWLTVDRFSGPENACDGYHLSIIKLEEMKQEVQTSEMLTKINTGEKLILYIVFEKEKFEIKSESQNIVNEIYKMLNEDMNLKILIEGHTDNNGSIKLNQILSNKRAESVKAALVAKGINGERIMTLGFGQNKPIVDNSNEENQAKNRRVEIKKI